MSNIKNTILTLEPDAVKLFIGDIKNLSQVKDRKYVSHIYSMTLKNILIEGMVTEKYNENRPILKFQVVDATGSVKIEYLYEKLKPRIAEHLLRGDFNRQITLKPYDRISNREEMVSTLNFLNSRIPASTQQFQMRVGDYVSVLGDLKVYDDGQRSISAFKCTVTDIYSYLVWKRELQWLYKYQYKEQIKYVKVTAPATVNT